MADVGDEVAPYRFDTARLGEVLNQQEHQPGTQRGDPGGDREGLAAARTAPRQVQFDLPYLTVPAGVPGHVQHRFDGQPAAPDQAQRIRGGAGLDDAVALVEHDRGGGEDGEDRVDSGGSAPLLSGRRDVRVGFFWSRSLQRNASMAITPVHNPAIAAAAATAAFTSIPKG